MIYPRLMPEGAWRIVVDKEYHLSVLGEADSEVDGRSVESVMAY